MSKQIVTIIVVCACVRAAAFGASYADGFSAEFGWTSAADVSGRFGQPLGSGVFNELFFPNSNFSVSADGGNPDVSISDTLSIDLVADPGMRFDSITIPFLGTRTINGTAGANSVQIDGALAVTALAGDAFGDSDSFIFFDDQPASSALWSDELSVVIPGGTNVTTLNLVLSKDLVADSTDGNAALTSTFDIWEVSMSAIPEPGTLALVCVGFAALVRRRARARGFERFGVYSDPVSERVVGAYNASERSARYAAC